MGYGVVGRRWGSGSNLSRDKTVWRRLGQAKMAWRLDELRLITRASKPLRKRVVRALLRLGSLQGIATSVRELLEAVFGIAVQVGEGSDSASVRDGPTFPLVVQ